MTRYRFLSLYPLRILGFIPLILFATFASPSVAADNAGVSVSKALPDISAADALWDGLYLGVHWAYGNGTTTWNDPAGYYSTNMDVSARGYNDGLIGGIQIGYRKQYDTIVLAMEADVNAGRMLGYATCGATAGFGGSGDNCGNRTDLIGSLTASLGYAMGRSLFYVKGGGAYSRDHTSVENYRYHPIGRVSTTSDHYGWTVGAGISYAITPNWSVNAEHSYYDFGEKNHTTGTGETRGSFQVDHTQHLTKFGLSYRMGHDGSNDTAISLSDNLTGEFGTRIGYSTGRFQKKLYSAYTPGQLNSVLTWDDQAGLAAEVFARFDHSSGLFLKGTFGGVSIAPNNMRDEDTAAAMDPYPYSNTVSSTKNSRDMYGMVDVGYTLLRDGRWNLGGFIGYGHYEQHLNAYGCEQVAGSIVCTPHGIVNPSAVALSEREVWKMLRLGLAGSVKFTERLKLSAEAVWNAYASLSAKDNHWFRPDINSLVEKGHGSKGYQLESIISYTISDRWDIGAGIRHLSLEAEGSTLFPYPAIPRSPEKFESSRTTTFVQGSYHF